MATLMESKTTARQHALIKRVLIAQTNSLGTLEAPIVEDLLRKNRCRSVLDVGCGEGSFLLDVAAGLKSTRFLGIDHNELALRDARRGLRRRALGNVRFETAFFDPTFAADRWDAVITRYTLQHSSRPSDFLSAAFARLKKKGLFVALESLDAYTGSPEPDPIWERYKIALAAIHKRIGSDANIGRSLGRLLRIAGFKDVRVWVALCSPSTVGWTRFRGVVRASAELACGFFSDLFDAALLNDISAWLDDRAALEKIDPHLCSAIAHGTRP
jgi:ubiquinone/menaquinone biosynthesis C-methylase UbiE